MGDTTVTVEDETPATPPVVVVETPAPTSGETDAVVAAVADTAAAVAAAVADGGGVLPAVEERFNRIESVLERIEATTAVAAVAALEPPEVETPEVEHTDDEIVPLPPRHKWFRGVSEWKGDK